MIKKSIFTSILLAFVSVIAGCEGGTSLHTVPAAGTVTMEGDPIEGVAVTLVPQAGVSGRGGYAVTDAQGRFTLQTSPEQTGVPAGRYRVLFRKLRMPDGSPIPEDAVAADVDAKNQLPEVYNDPQLSPVSAIIPAEGDEELSFDLQSRPRRRR